MKQVFKEHLEMKGLLPRSVETYLFYYDKFNKDFTQESVDKFIHKYNYSSVVKAFINNYRRFLLRQGNNEELRKIEIVQKRRNPKRLPKIITEEQVFKIENVMTNERDKIMLLLTFYGGLRLTELITITPGAIDTEKYFHCKKTGNPAPIKIDIIGKGDKQRKIFVPYWLIHRVGSWNYRNPSGGMDQQLFKISKRRWQAIITVYSKKALGYSIYPHILRHSFATYLLDNGFGIEEVKELLGHESIVTTQIYAHISMKALEKKYSSLIGTRN